MDDQYVQLILRLKCFVPRWRVMKRAGKIVANYGWYLKGRIDQQYANSELEWVLNKKATSQNMENLMCRISVHSILYRATLIHPSNMQTSWWRKIEERIRYRPIYGVHNLLKIISSVGWGTPERPPPKLEKLM